MCTVADDYWESTYQKIIRTSSYRNWSRQHRGQKKAAMELINDFIIFAFMDYQYIRGSMLPSARAEQDNKRQMCC